MLHGMKLNVHIAAALCLYALCWALRFRACSHQSCNCDYYIASSDHSPHGAAGATVCEHWSVPHIGKNVIIIFFIPSPFTRNNCSQSTRPTKKNYYNSVMSCLSVTALLSNGRSHILQFLLRNNVCDHF